NARSALQRQINWRRDGDDDRGGCGIFFTASQNRETTFIASRNRTRLSQTRPAESDLERRRSAAFEIGHTIETWRWSRGKRADSENAQARLNALSFGGTDDWIAHGRCRSSAKSAPSAGR